MWRGGGGGCSLSFFSNWSQMKIDQMKPGRIWSTENEAGLFRKVDVS